MGPAGPAAPSACVCCAFFQRRSLAPSQLAKRKAGDEEEEERHPPTVSEGSRDMVGIARVPLGAAGWGGLGLGNTRCLPSRGAGGAERPRSAPGRGVLVPPPSGDRGSGPRFTPFSSFLEGKFVSGHAVGKTTWLCVGDASWLWRKLSLGELAGGW